MKPWLIIVVSVLILFALVVRIIYKNFHKVQKEREWYIEHLNYNFSAEVDSTVLIKNSFGYIYFHVIRGQLNRSVEDSLNRHLKYHKSVWFLPRRKDKITEIVSGNADLFKPGDSLVVNSSESKIKFFRNNHQIFENNMTSHLYKGF